MNYDPIQEEIKWWGEEKEEWKITNSFTKTLLCTFLCSLKII